MQTKNNDIKNFFNRAAGEAPHWRKRNWYYHESLENFLRFVIPAGKSVLEIGCGIGETLAALKPSRGVGVDFAPAMIEIAQKEHPELNFLEGAAENLPLQECFDYVLLSDLIGNLHDVQSSFDELHKVTDETSRVIITYHNHLWEWILSLAERLHLKMPQPRQNWLGKRDAANILSLAGFETIKSGSLILIPIYIPFISNFCNRYLARIPLIKHFSAVEYIIACRRPRQSHKEYSVSVIIPARNEAGNIEAAVARLPNLGSRTEIIFVEGGSKDNTADEIARVKEKYKNKNIVSLKQDGRGKGDAVRKGFSAATGEILMILDADLTVPPEDLPKFYRAIRTREGEFVMGSRLVYPMENEAMRFLNILGNKFFSSAFSWLLDQPLKDTLCGTKVMFRADYEELARNRDYFGEFDPFGDFDLIFGAAKMNLKILEIPIRYRARTYGATNISRFRHGWLLLKMTAFAARKIKFI